MNRYEIALGTVEEVSKDPIRSPQLSEEQRSNIYRDFMQTAEGRQRLATSLVEPLRLRLNARSFARRIFNVDRLPNGSLPIYDKGPETTAYVVNVNEEGDNILLAISQGHRVILPIFPINSVQRIPLTMLREQMRRNVTRNPIDNCIDGIIQDLVREEEIKAIGLLDATDPYDRRIINIPTIDDFNETILVEAMSEIETLELRVGVILVNSQDFIIMRSNFSRDTLDVNTSIGMIENGLVGTMSDRTWVCPECGTVHDRDVNAAVNVRAEGINIFNKSHKGTVGTTGTDLPRRQVYAQGDCVRPVHLQNSASGAMLCTGNGR